MDIKRLLLAHCWDEEAIEEKSPRIIRALEKAEITDENISHAIAAMDRDYTSKGARLAQGVILERYTDIALCKEEGKQFILHVHPGLPRLNMAIYNAVGHEKLCVEFPDAINTYIYPEFYFNNMVKVQEAADNAGMGQELAHCGINKSSLGAIELGYIPKPDAVIGGGYQCDQGAKYVEFLGEKYDIPYFLYDSVRNEDWGFFPQVDQKNVEYFADSIKNINEQVGNYLGVEITDDHWGKARREYGRLWSNIFALQKIVINADPRPIKVTDETPAYWITLDPDWRTADIHDAFEILLEDAEERAENGEGVLPKGAPRINLCCPANGRTNQLFEECGLNVVMPGDYAWVAPWELGKGHNYEGWRERIAEAYLRKGYVRCSYDHVHRFQEMAKELNLDGVAYGWYWACRVLTQPGPWIKEHIEKELGIPATYFEQDDVDPRSSRVEELRTKLETFAALLKARKASKASQSSMEK